MNNIVRSCLVLFTVSVVCVAALAYVHEITLEPIKAQDLLAENNAFNEIFPDADDFRKNDKTAPSGTSITDITGVYKGGESKGYVIRLAQKGYGGAINMMVGISTDGSVAGITVLSHSETPGLGAICESPSFTEEFKGRSKFPLIVSKAAASENEIDAITSATITTNAVVDAVNTAYTWFESEGGGN